jgi:hypothetical protein
MSVYIVQFSTVYSQVVKERVSSIRTFVDMAILNVINIKLEGMYMHVKLLVAARQGGEYIKYTLTQFYTVWSNKPFDFTYSKEGSI